MALNVKRFPKWFKRLTAIFGLLLILPGIPITFGFLCFTLISVLENDSGTIFLMLLFLVMTMLTLGTGGTLFWHGLASLEGKHSKPFRLPSTRKLSIGFVLYWGIGIFIFQNEILAGLFFAPSVILASAIPPIAVVVWLMRNPNPNISWRRGSIVFMGSAAVSLIFIIVLQGILLLVSSVLYTNPIDGLVNNLDAFEDLLSHGLFQRIFWDRSSLFVFIQIALIIPVIGTLAKSLIVVPFIGQINRRDTFHLAAIAGAGYATFESLIFFGSNLENWIWILPIFATSAAVHPVGAGLIALGWRDLLKSKSMAFSNCLASFGVASALHSLWNLGFLVIFYSGILYLFEVGLFIALFLVLLGALSLWIGYSAEGQLGNRMKQIEFDDETKYTKTSNRYLAIWAISILFLIVPVGIVGINLVF